MVVPRPLRVIPTSFVVDTARLSEKATRPHVVMLQLSVMVTPLPVINLLFLVTPTAPLQPAPLPQVT